MNYQSCFRCDHELLADDIAIYRKLVNRGASDFLCMDCLAKDMRCTALTWKNL
ncbi:MAG: hypothetical protein IJ688_11280 [Treponema sp.]|nr:hypothetical protein [Treponema sp.]